MVELELGDGLKLWTRVDDLQRDFASEVTRDGESGVDGEIPLYLSTGGQSRGVAGKFLVKTFRVFGVDLEGGATAAAKAVAKQSVEDKLDLGLHRCTAEGPGAFAPVGKLAGDAPTLVLLHGTASSTEGSFGGLWTGGSASRMRRLLERYEGRVLAFEHRTLTQSPVENALELAKKLGVITTAHCENADLVFEMQKKLSSR